VLLFAQAALFFWGGLVTSMYVASRLGNPNLPDQVQLGIKQGAGFAVCAVLAVFNWRGSRRALYATAVISAVSSLVDLGLATILFVWVGPLAFLYLLFYPLPYVPLGVVAIPVVILSLSVIGRGIRDPRVPAPAGLPIAPRPAPAGTPGEKRRGPS
jgi:hypothetical protein